MQGNQHSQGVLQGEEPGRRSQDRELLVVHLEVVLLEHMQEVHHLAVPVLGPIVQGVGPDPVDPGVGTDPVLGRAGDADQVQKLGQRDKVLKLG